LRCHADCVLFYSFLFAASGRPPGSTLFPYTTLFRSGHSVRVADYSARMGRQMGLSQAVMDGVALGAELHDIGKIGVSEGDPVHQDRKSTRLNSSHVSISYAVFCLKKKINNCDLYKRL